MSVRFSSHAAGKGEAEGDTEEVCDRSLNSSFLGTCVGLSVLVQERWAGRSETDLFCTVGICCNTNLIIWGECGNSLVLSIHLQLLSTWIGYGRYKAMTQLKGNRNKRRDVPVGGSCLFELNINTDNSAV